MLHLLVINFLSIYVSSLFVFSLAHLLCSWEESCCGMLLSMLVLHGQLKDYSLSYVVNYGSYLLCRDYLSPEDIIRNYPHLVIIGTGLAFGFLVVRYALIQSLNSGNDILSVLNSLISIVYMDHLQIYIMDMDLCE